MFNKGAAVKGPGNECGVGRKMGDPGVHELGHTVRRLQSGGREGLLKGERSDAKTDFVLFFISLRALQLCGVTV